ncbi:MarR family winged helix-turn-helix transcriptional regulator [Herbaspirillum sp. RV1423]|uniref:MarR family winged helix-turn-helix transcriptional regulator n=1 Tax=Herbaspirillum sp. RV1423 TaxID=1443993 RepID=UPI000550670E|nr:MarR family winged helix-turn-helix transcriptional regulator [Herbaspirillum sp. RV1423]
MFNQCTCTRLRRLTRRITSIYDRHLLPDELTISQYSLLSRVGRHGPIANIRLAAEMGMDRSTLSRNIKPLMSAGWIATVDMPPDEHVDKRSFGLALSPAGKAKLDAARPHWVKAQLEIDGLLGEDMHAALSGMIDDAYDRLQEA